MQSSQLHTNTGSLFKGSFLYFDHVMNFLLVKCEIIKKIIYWFSFDAVFFLQNVVTVCKEISGYILCPTGGCS